MSVARPGRREERGAAPEVLIERTVGPRLLSDPALRAAVRAALSHGGRVVAGIGLVLVGDAELRELHERFLGDPSPTDVITFDLADEIEPGGGEVEAEIYVSVECAARVARRRGTSGARELALYAVHGALHLCGYDDRDPADRRRMRRAEGLVLERLGYGRTARAPGPRSARPR